MRHLHKRELLFVTWDCYSWQGEIKGTCRPQNLHSVSVNILLNKRPTLSVYSMLYYGLSRCNHSSGHCVSPQIRYGNHQQVENVGWQRRRRSVGISRHFRRSYLNKNLAIANRSCVSCAHSTSTTSIVTPWPWNLIRGHSRSLKLVPFESLGVVSYSPSIVTMVLSLSSTRYRDLLVENRKCFYTPRVFIVPQGVTPSEFREDVWYSKLGWLDYCAAKKLWQYVKPFR